MRIQIAIVGATIGLISGGVFGAVIGFLIGLYVDYITSESSEDSSQGNNARRRQPEQDEGFGMSLLILIAATMNADGVTLKSELEMVKSMLVRTYGEHRAKQMLLVLRELIKQRQDVTMVCRQFRGRMAYSQRLELLHVLFRISRADGEINQKELELLNYIGVHLGISHPDYLALSAMFVSTPDSDYKILDVLPGADETEVKKAYRTMAMRFHPDRLTGLSDAEKNAAQEKFIKVQKAYESIKRKKGWK